MKLKFERFEGLCSFSIRGEIVPSELKILQIGLENLVKDLDATLVVNMTLTTFNPALLPVLQAIKRSLVPPAKIKVHWITTVKNLGDFPTLVAFTSRLTGFKHRQIGERLSLDDEIHVLHDDVLALQAKVESLSGDEQKAQALILENRILKEQNRILNESIRFQKERMKHQIHLPTQNEELAEKRKAAREELLKIYTQDYGL